MKITLMHLCCIMLSMDLTTASNSEGLRRFVIAHTHWQIQQDGQEDIAVYSAFYDDRPIVGVLPWIRILGVRRLPDNPLWCYVWYSHEETPFVAQAEITDTGVLPSFRMNDGNYSQNLFSCQTQQLKLHSNACFNCNQTLFEFYNISGNSS